MVRGRKLLVVGATVIASLGITVVAAAAPDTTFSGDGQASTAEATELATMVSPSSGSVIAIGPSTAGHASVTHFDAGGGIAGTTPIGGTGLQALRGTAVTPSGMVVQFQTAGNGIALTRIDADGGQSSGFGSGGWTYESLGSCGSGDGAVADVAAGPDGSIYTVAWNFLGNTPSECDGSGIRRYNATGQRVAWGATRYEGVLVDNRLESMAITVDGNGNVYTAGVVFGATGDDERVGVLKVGDDGAPAAGFGDRGLVSVDVGTETEWYGGVDGFSRTFAARSAADVAVDGQGRILLVGAGPRRAGTGTGIDVWVARLLPNGSLDGSFGSGGVAVVDLGGSADYGLRIAVDASDRPVVAGVTQPLPITRGRDNRAELVFRMTAAGNVSGAVEVTDRVGGPYQLSDLTVSGSRVVTAGRWGATNTGYVSAHTFGSAATPTTGPPPATSPTTTTSISTSTTTTTATTPTPTSTSTSTPQPGAEIGGGTPTAPFTGITPWRAVDTRATGGPVDAGATRSVVVAGTHGVPATAVAVALNVTVVDPTHGGYLTVYPSGRTTPTASTANFAAQHTVANSIVVGVGPGGSVELALGAGRAHVLVDVMGWFAPGTGLRPLTPLRAADTRPIAALGPYEARTFSVADARTTGVSGATAVVLNVTAVDPTAAGHLRAWPGIGAEPHASVLNFATHQTVANELVLGVDAHGRVTVANHSAGTVHLVLDVAGVFSGHGAVHAITPVRAHDSRDAGGALAPWEHRAIPVTGLQGVPADGSVRGVVANITVTDPTGDGFLSVNPGGAQASSTSLLNFTRGVTVANATVIGLGPDGTIEVRNSVGSTHVVVDVLGWF